MVCSKDALDLPNGLPWFPPDLHNFSPVEVTAPFPIRVLPMMMKVCRFQPALPSKQLLFRRDYYHL